MHMHLMKSSQISALNMKVNKVSDYLLVTNGKGKA